MSVTFSMVPLRDSITQMMDSKHRNEEIKEGPRVIKSILSGSYPCKDQGLETTRRSGSGRRFVPFVVSNSLGIPKNTDTSIVQY